MFPFNRFTVCLLRVPTPLLSKAANNLQYVPFQQIHRLFASCANPIARYARMVGTLAYGLGACVAFSLVGQTCFARLHCSAFGHLAFYRIVEGANSLCSFAPRFDL